MSYINENNDNFIYDINHRKEFINNYIDNSKKNLYIDDLIKNSNKLILNNYQQFITNFINPHTYYSRLLLVHSTGVGKTITSLMTAINFINIYKQEYELDNKNQFGMIYIIGFTKNIYKKELFSRTEFGILTQNEINEFNLLKKQIFQNNLEKDIIRYKELKQKYNKRLHSKKGNGYFTFIGYKELFNKLIMIISDDIKIDDIKNEKELESLINSNKIKINTLFLDQFKKSLIICDEIHNIYNSLDTNNWGLSLEIILNYHNSIRALFLSATPINNNPIEVISIIKLLNSNANISENDSYQQNKFMVNPNINIKKDDIFNSSNDITPNGIKLIKKYTIGKISYLKDMNLELYPEKIIHGESIKDIDYLKFIKCPMSNLHFKTYEYLSSIMNDKDKNNKGDKNDKEVLEIISNLKKYPLHLEGNNKYLTDIVLPNPGSMDKGFNPGIYLKNDLKLIQSAKSTWKNANNISIEKDNYSDFIITGNILLENNIKKYSNKYYNLLLLIKDIVTNNKGKLFIYHNFIQFSGINLIKEMFKVNGYIEADDTPTKYTRCSKCYNFKHEHKSNYNHEFLPLKFITITGQTDKNIIDKQLDDLNNTSNINGDYIKIILGSKATKESYNFLEIQNLIILHQPDNISTLIQIFGRAIRKNSHIKLPIDKRKVNIYILVSTLPDYIQHKFKSVYIYSYEELKYKSKINTYKIIQSIMDIFIENAIDSNINYNINFPSSINTTTAINDIYYIKPIDNNKLTKINYKHLNLFTFQSYYYNDEINTCKYIIKRLFIEYSSVMTFNDIYKSVLSPYFPVNFNTSLISKYSIIIALDFLIYNKNNITFNTSDGIGKGNNINNTLIDNLFNSNEKIIIDLNNNQNIIVYMDKYYILVPINKYNSENSGSAYLEYDNIFNDHDFIPEKQINLDNLVNYNTNIDNYNFTKKYFINKYNKINIDKLFNIISEFDFNFHLLFIEELIEYFFNIYTNPNKKPDINHEFYLKILYFYNKFNIIIFANKLDTDLLEIYDKYIIPTKSLNVTVSDDHKINYNYSNLINSLESESESTEIANNSQLYFHFYKNAIKESNNFIFSKNNKIKIFDYLLPIGHVFDSKLKFYHPSNYWFNKLDYNHMNIKFKNNNIIIGFLEKNNIGFDIVFKIKDPISSYNKSDLRTLSSGLNCITKDKNDLINICKKLKINLSLHDSKKKTLCDLIKFDLIKKELYERKHNTNIKYFYFYWETYDKT